MPSQDYESCIFEYFSLLLIVLLNLRAVVWRSITEYDDTVAIHEVRLHIVFLWEHRLSLVWQAKMMLMQI